MEKVYITDESLYGFNYYKYGIAYTGSFNGMRYRLHRDPMVDLTDPKNKDEIDNPDARLVCEVYEDLVCFEKTKPENMIIGRFAFSEEGKQELGVWLNSIYKEKYADIKE